MKNNEQSTELKQLNRCAVASFIISMSIVMAFTVAQSLLIGTSLLSYLPTYIILVIGILWHLYYYPTHKASKLIPHTLSWFCGLGYFILLITTDTYCAFTYCIPMMIILSTYGDLRFSRTVNIAIIFFNTTDCILMGVQGTLSNSDILSITIRLCFMLMLCIVVELVTKLTLSVNKLKTDTIECEKDKVTEMLDNVLNISGAMITDISDITSNMGVFANSVAETQTAMEEVSKGTNETAESVQVQLIKTEEIQNQIGNVKDASTNIETDLSITKEAISQGETNIKELISQVEISETASTTVAKELKDLNTCTEQMHSIIEVINNVASQTSLLSLNASIEAARAGEAGRGFAVVAGEISNLAKQTQDATSNISNLIENISNVVDVVIDSINHLIESNDLQAAAAAKSAESFTNIKSSAIDIYKRSADMIASITALAASNHEIIESISTISAITEEVSAHSNATYSSSEKNNAIVQKISNLVDSLSSNANQLTVSTDME